MTRKRDSVSAMSAPPRPPEFTLTPAWLAYIEYTEFCEKQSREAYAGALLRIAELEEQLDCDECEPEVWGDIPWGDLD